MTDDKPTFDTVITESLSTLDLGATITPLPDKFGKDYKALHNWHLEHLATKVGELPDITDSKTYDANQKARTRLVNIRTGLDKTRKALFEPMRRLKSEVDDYIGTTADSGLQARLKALERIIEAKQDAWDAERERERQEAIRVIEERTAARNKRMLDAGASFDGATYRIGEVAIALREIANISDELFGRLWDQSIAPAAAMLAEEKLVGERFAALLDAGMRPDPTTGHATYTMRDGATIIVMREELRRLESEDVVKTCKLIADDIEAVKRTKDEEHEAMRRRFAEQAERERKADEERAELDRQREALHKEKQAVRHERLLALGAEWDERGFYHVGGDLCQIVDNLADMKEETWQMALEAVPRAKEKWDAMQAEKQRKNELSRDRALALLNHGAVRDEAGAWTLGTASTTDKLLGEMDAEAWEATQAAFSAEEVAIAAQSAQHPTVEETATRHVDTRELLACALALLDEANKCETIAAGDLDDDECEQMCVKVVAHAHDCVKLIRELQTKRA